MTSLDALLNHPGLNAAVNLTPAPLHCEVTTALLNAGLSVFSEKPLAGTVDDGQELIALAKRKGKLLLCAPAVMATNRMRWLKRVIAAGKIGTPTLAVAQMANMGPSGWRQYTGDPAVFYTAGVGPLIDTGVYVLHAITGLLGPVKRVQAFGGIVIPKRTVLIERLLGQEIEVGTNDQMLIHLDFGNNVFAQILSSFAVPRTKMPALELHGTGGTVSFSIAGVVQRQRSGRYLPSRRVAARHRGLADRPAAGREPARQPDRGRRAPFHRLSARRGGADPDGGARLPRPRHHARGRQGSGLRRDRLARNHVLGHETHERGPRAPAIETTDGGGNQ